MGSELDWRRLHPASVAVNLLPRTWRFLRGSWPLLLALLYGGGPDATNVVDLGIIAFFFAMTVGSTVMHYLTLRYRVADGRLEIATGLLNRQVRTIDPERIQNTELVRGPFHRAAGLVEVRIETASGTDVEGLLSALDEREAEDLVARIEASTRRARALEDDETEEVDAPPLVTNDLGDLFRYGATATRFGAAVLVAFGVLMDALVYVDPERVDDIGVSPVGAVAIGVALFSGAWIVGIGSSVLRFHGFTLTVGRGRMVARAGLLTTRRVDLPIDKVQLVSVSQAFLRRLLGFGSAQIETAAARVGGGGTESAQAVVPVVERGDFARIVGAAIPTADVDPWQETLARPHPRALYRAVLGGVWRGLLVGAVASWLFWPWGLVAWLFLPANVVAAVLDHRHQGWCVTDRVIVSRKGYWNRRTHVVSRAKIQSIELVQGPIQRRWGLARLVVRVAGSQVALPEVAWEDGEATLTALSRRARAA